MSRSALAAGLRQLRGKLAVQQHRDDSDEQLLHAFTSRRDDSAFAALVYRHGPMVLHVCRRLLGHEQDAEDAFQATFLVLAQHAASLRNKSSLAGFLHGTAYRTAMKAKRTAGRRRKHEGALGALTQPRSPVDPVDELSWREVRALLDEEIAQMPEEFRVVFVLFHLERLSREETARRLGLKSITVAKRLAEARKRLGQRLARRGVELTAALAATGLATQQASALSAGLIATTIKAALATMAGEEPTGIVSASVVELTQSATTAMIVSKAKIAAGVLLAIGALTGAGLWAHRGLDVPVAAEQPPPPAQAAMNPKTQKDTSDEEDRVVEIRGVVVDADGNPFSDAKVYFLARHRQMQAEPAPDFAKARALTDANGRFHFRVARSQLLPSEDEEIRFIQNTHKTAVVTAVGAGHGPGWATIRKIEDAGHLTLKLAKDDVPIRGRVVDLEGRPISGVKVRVMLVMPMQTESLLPWLATVPLQKKNGSSLWRVQGAEIYPKAAGLDKAAITDGEGRFQLRGIGRERVAKLRFEGPAIETRDVFVLTLPCPTFELPYPSIPPSKDKYVYYGATFEHAAAPTVPIFGTVCDKDTGKPLAGIIIQARIPSPEGSPYAEGGPATDYLRTVSDKDGHYRLVGLPKRPGQIVRAYSGPGQAYFRFGKRVSDGVGLAPVRMDFELKRGVLIRGRVKDKATGKPVQAEVEYFIFSDDPEHVEGAGGFSQGGSMSTWSGEDGSFSLVGLPRRGLLAARVFWAKADRYISAAGAERIKGANRTYFFPTYPYTCNAARFHSVVEVNPAKDAELVECNLAIDPGKTVTGTVLDSEGRALPGAHIEGPGGILPRFPQDLKSARFTVKSINPNTPRWFYFLHKEKQLGAAVRLTGNEPKDFTIRLQPCATLVGRVVDSDGRPRAGLELAGHLGWEQTAPGAGSGGFWGVKTDKDGRFRVASLIPGLKWRAVFVQEGNVLTGQLLRNLVLQAGETKDLGDLQVQPIEDD